METETKSINEKLIRLAKDVELIKNILMSEGELTDYAKTELVKARDEKEENYTNLEDL